MQCSFILPAHNEQDWIGGSIWAIQKACAELNVEYEIVVAADSCTDDTVGIASQLGARVVELQARQIAVARNTGARTALGNTIFFVDADTEANPQAIRLGLRALENGALAGGSTMNFDGPIPLLTRITMRAFCVALHLAGFAGGCFLFCRREVFEAVGGFDEKLFVTEEISFAKKIKQHGKFQIVPGRVLTSARKVRSHSVRESLSIVYETLKQGKGAYRDRDRLAFWYGDRREDPGRSMGNAVAHGTRAMDSASAKDEPVH